MTNITDTAGVILLYGFFLMAGATPIILLALSVLNLIRSSRRWYLILVEVVAALVVWAVLTFGVFSALFVMAFSMPGNPSSRDAANIKMTVAFGFMWLAYGLAMAGLIYLLKRRAKP